VFSPRCDIRLHRAEDLDPVNVEITDVEDEEGNLQVRGRCANEVAYGGGVVRASQQRQQERAGVGWVDAGLVFTRPDGTALDPCSVSRRFDRLVGRSGLPRIRLHDQRHTSASIGLASGESLLEVSRRLGHSSISITADIYSTGSADVARESAERRSRHIFHQ
jgi:integrase